MTSRRPRNVAPSITTLFRDSHLHAIAKPAGVATVSERWDRQLPTAIELLWEEWQAEDPNALRPHVIHRLDKDTTGVLLFACHRDAQAEVRRQFRERQVQKRYLALVRGAPVPRAGTVEIEVAEDPRKAGRMRVVKRGGKACATHYETIEEFRDLALVRLAPHTGRTHQIRVSLASIGTPCAIDPLYGGAEALFLSAWKRGYKRGRGEPERPVIDRLTLHAESLEIRHPETGEPLRIEAPLPRDLEVTLKHLRRYDAV